jgi:hypothetical protein
MLTEQKIDAFFENPLIAYAFLWAPVVAVSLSSLFTRRFFFSVRVIAALFFGCAAWVLACLPWMAWTIPGGLLPDGEPVHGDARVAEFFDKFWPILILSQLFVLAGVLVCIGGVLYRERRK